MEFKLKELRLSSNLSQMELANKLGTTQRNLSNWENGITQPDFTTLIKIADFFNVSIDYLLTFNGAKKENLSTLERVLIKEFREASPEKQRAIISLLK